MSWETNLWNKYYGINCKKPGTCGFENYIFASYDSGFYMYT